MGVDSPDNGNANRVAAVPQREVASEFEAKPQLVFFHSPLSGRCRRVEGFVAQVLQRRQNHATFDLVRVAVDTHPGLARKFGIVEVPTLCVVERQKLRRRIVSPHGCREIERELEPWLR